MYVDGGGLVTFTFASKIISNLITLTIRSSSYLAARKPQKYAVLVHEILILQVLNNIPLSEAGQGSAIIQPSSAKQGGAEGAGLRQFAEVRPVFLGEHPRDAAALGDDRAALGQELVCLCVRGLAVVGVEEATCLAVRQQVDLQQCSCRFRCPSVRSARDGPSARVCPVRSFGTRRVREAARGACAPGKSWRSSSPQRFRGNVHRLWIPRTREQRWADWSGRRGWRKRARSHPRRLTVNHEHLRREHASSIGIHPDRIDYFPI